MRSWLAAVLLSLPALAEPQTSGLPALKEDLAAEIAERVGRDVAIESRIAAEEVRASAAEQRLRLDVEGVVAHVTAAPTGWLLADGEGNPLGIILSAQLAVPVEGSQSFRESLYLVARQDGADWSFWTIGGSVYAAGAAAVRAPSVGLAWRSADCTGEALLGWGPEIPTGLVVRASRDASGYFRVGHEVVGETAVSWYQESGDGTRTCASVTAPAVRPLFPTALPESLYTEYGFLKAPLAIVPR